MKIKLIIIICIFLLTSCSIKETNEDNISKQEINTGTIKQKINTGTIKQKNNISFYNDFIKGDTNNPDYVTKNGLIEITSNIDNSIRNNIDNFLKKIDLNGLFDEFLEGEISIKNCYKLVENTNKCKNKGNLSTFANFYMVKDKYIVLTVIGEGYGGELFLHNIYDIKKDKVYSIDLKYNTIKTFYYDGIFYFNEYGKLIQTFDIVNNKINIINKVNKSNKWEILKSDTNLKIKKINSNKEINLGDTVDFYINDKIDKYIEVSDNEKYFGVVSIFFEEPNNINNKSINGKVILKVGKLENNGLLKAKEIELNMNFLAIRCINKAINSFYIKDNFLITGKGCYNFEKSIYDLEKEIFIFKEK